MEEKKKAALAVVYEEKMRAEKEKKMNLELDADQIIQEADV
jgi:hypothetical protein